MYSQGMIIKTEQATTSGGDSRYAVADILSTMATSGSEPLTPTTYRLVASFTSSAATSATPTLTPGSVEKTFMELGPPDSRSQAGFVPPIVENMHASMDMLDTSSQSSVSSSNYSSTPRRSDRRRIRDEDLPPEEAHRRAVRRERNKLAAAKCRKRRVDLTNTLTAETEVLEEEKTCLREEVAELQRQKEDLEMVLQAHICKIPHKQSVSHDGQQIRNTSAQAGLSRPTSLPVRAIAMQNHASHSVTEATGISITTPSSMGMFCFDADIPPMTPSCGTQVHTVAKHHCSGSSDGMASPTQLVSL